MTNSRAHPVYSASEQAVWDKITAFDRVYNQRLDGMLSLQELENVPTFREIIQSKAFDVVRSQNLGIDVYELKEKDLEIQNYVLGRYLEQIKECTNDTQRAREYQRVIKAFDRYSIDASAYLSRIQDRDQRWESRELIKMGAAAHVKEKLAFAFNNFRLHPDDKAVIESSSSKPNDKFESLLRPFNMKAAEPWLKELERAGYDYGDEGLTEAIMPSNALTTPLSFEHPVYGTQPA